MKSPYKDETIETWLVQVSGRVQGVGYRNACVKYARAQGIAGWVRNRRDGSVALTLQGSPGQLADMRGWLSHGIPAALVVELEITELPLQVPRFEHFDRLPTL
jgi:acylphosphatase